MEINMKKFTADCLEPVCAKRIRQDGSADCVIPDSLPDAAELVYVTGSALIRSKDLSEGAVSVELNVAAQAVFAPEGGGALGCVELNIPVSLRLEDENINSDCRCMADYRLVSLEGKLLNPRKILVKADVSTDISCWAESALELTEDTEDGGSGLNTLCTSVTLTPVKCVSEKTFVLTDEHMIPADRPAAEAIIGQSVTLTPEDLKIAGTKLIIKGSAKAKLLLSAADGSEMPLEFSVPFSQICETGKQCAEAVCTACVVPSGAYFELLRESEGRTVTAEIHAVAQFMCREKLTVPLLSDAYSNLYELTVSRSERVFPTVEREMTLRCNLEAAIETPYEARSVIVAEALAGPAEAEGSALRVPVSVSILYVDADGSRRLQKKRLTAELSCSCAENETAEVTNVSVGEMFCVASGRAIELRAPVEVRALAVCEQKTECISGIERSEERRGDVRELPSAVLVKVSGRGGLWEAAKRHCSTVEAIRAVNSLEEDCEPAGERLLVPKIIT